MSTLLRSFAAVALASFLAACGGADPADGEDVSETEAALSANDKVAFDYFRTKGLTPVQAAGIVGNLDQESSMNPASVQFGGGPGRGIAQWSVGGRWDRDKNDNAVGYAAKHNANVHALRTQLDFIWYELNTFPGYGLGALKKAKDVTTATRVFEKEFEGCGVCLDGKRITYANAALKAYGKDNVAPPAPAAPPAPKPAAEIDAGPIATADAGAGSDPTQPDDEPYTDPVSTDPTDTPDPAEATNHASTADRASLDSGAGAGCSASPLRADDASAGIAALVFAAGVLARRRSKTRRKGVTRARGHAMEQAPWTNASTTGTRHPKPSRPCCTPNSRSTQAASRSR